MEKRGVERIFMVLIIYVLLIILSIVKSYGQGIYINEVSQGEGGNKEYIELLVAGSEKCSVVDLRSWIIDDNNGDFGTGGISRGYIKFTDDILWSRVMSGTIIVLWNVEDTSLVLKNSGLAIIDTDPNDFRLVIPVGCKNIGTVNQQCPSSQYIVGVTNIPTTTNSSYNNPFVLVATTFRWNTLVAFGNSVDAVQTRRPDGSFFHGLGYGTNTLHPESSIYGANRLSFSPIGNTYSATNQIDFDIRDKRNWSVSTTKTPTIPNSLENEDFINSIRVDDDCTLDIKYSTDVVETDVETEVVNYYNYLGQLLPKEQIYNRPIIKETILKNGDIIRQRFYISR
jgi:hypothetical protein